MVYVTGDTHGFVKRFMYNNMGDDDWGKDDFLIICGDFGFGFENTENDKKRLDFLAAKPYTICFCDGNHENFSMLKGCPVEKWHGGLVHRIRENVIHLMRGQVFELENKTFFTFGGAYSEDRERRQEGVSWWEDEMPNQAEMNIGRENLERYNYKVDYIITHTVPQEISKRLIQKLPWDLRMDMELHFSDYKLTSFLGEILEKTEFKHWYFGHWHFDMSVDEKSTAVLNEVHKLE